MGLGTSGGTLSALDPGSYGVKTFSQGEYFFTQFRVIVTYLRLLFFPVNQSIDYDYPVYKSFFAPQVFLSFIFLAALFGLGLYLISNMKGDEKPFARFTIHDSRPLRLIGFGILWFFITLSVESGIVPLNMLVDEYRVYLPSVGLIIGVVTAAFMIKAHSPKAGRITVAILALAIVALSFATYLRNEVWGDTIRLWEDTAQKAPLNSRVHFNLGVIYKYRNMFEMAKEQYLIAIKLRPDYAEAYSNLGNIYQTYNILDRAEESYLLAVKFKPDFPEAHYNLGIIYQTLNMPDKAMEQYLLTIKFKPDCAEAHNNLGVMYQARAMTDKAEKEYLLAVKLKPDYAEAHYNLGVISYQVLKMLDRAMNELQIALTLEPDNAEAHFNLGFVYYNMGQREKVERELRAGLRIKPDDQQARQLLNMVSR